MRFFFKSGKVLVYTMLGLASIGGIGTLAHLLPASQHVTVQFVSPASANALAVHAVKQIMTIQSGLTQADRNKTLEQFGWQASDFKATGATVSVLDATPLDPKVLSSIEEIVPVELWLSVQTPDKTRSFQNEIANVLVLADAKGNVVLAGPPYLEPAAPQATLADPSNTLDTTTIRPVIETFLQTWWSGGDVTNDIASGAKLPDLPFKTSTLSIQKLEATQSGKNQAQVVVNISVVDPVTGVSMPVQMIMILEQPDKNHWLIDQVNPY